jgi:F-type H+-transporting ATPase subunit delta
VTTSSKAQTYASVVFETALKDWLNGLGAAATALSHSPGVRRTLADQAVSFKEKQDILVALLPATPSVPASVRNFLLGMLSNGDITLLDEVVDEINHLAVAAGGPRAVPAEITSAVELTSEERLAIQNRLIEQHGANLEFKFIVNPAILGGLVVRVGDKLLDTSLSSRMAALRHSLGVASTS